ncbi:MAG: hypothetical protein RJQ03_04045, partial [Miltoncostaeaceae bacterium]
MPKGSSSPCTTRSGTATASNSSRRSGFGAAPACAGLAFLYGGPNTDGFEVFLSLGITAVAVVSVVAGLD